jgi:hypothetical protein
MTKAIEVNCATGEVTERELTSSEMADRATAAKAAADQQLALEAEAKAKETKRQALATKLGLTADDLAALLP